MKYKTEDIRAALCREYEWLCHDDPPRTGELTESEYKEYVSKLDYDQLVFETSCDEQIFTLDDFMEHWGELDDNNS